MQSRQNIVFTALEKFVGEAARRQAIMMEAKQREVNE